MASVFFLCIFDYVLLVRTQTFFTMSAAVNFTPFRELIAIATSE